VCLEKLATGFSSNRLVSVWRRGYPESHIRASTAVNFGVEETLAHLNDEIQVFVRTLKGEDQAIQESVAKTELMERRLEAVKKRADTIVDLEGELSNAKKQKRAFEEAVDQVQADLNAQEQDNAKLKDGECPGMARHVIRCVC
jgi:dynactin 1